MATGACPLCRQEAEVSEDASRRIRHFRCETCGKYAVTEEAEDDDLSRATDVERALVSGVTRERSDQKSPITIVSSRYEAPDGAPTGFRVSEILGELAPQSVPERVDRALLNLERKSRYPGQVVSFKIGRDYPLLFAEGAQAAGFIRRHMVDAGLLKWDKEGGALTPEGWRRVGELRRLRPDSKLGFVAMWFDPQLNDVWANGLKAAIEDAGYAARRVDKVEYNGKIDDYIVAEIRRSRFVVADMTGHRPAVYFEAGFAMGLGLTVIFTCHVDHLDECNFDTRQYNHIVWDSPEVLRERLKNRILATIV